MTETDQGPPLARPDPAADWGDLRKLTPARVALGRAGASLPTAAQLAFALDHARARDAALAPFDAEAIARELRGLGLQPLLVHSRTRDRANYMRRPDLGRRLDGPSAARLAGVGGACDIALVVGDGLSPAAVHAHALGLIAELLPRLAGSRLGAVAIATGARVALGDEIGAILQARLVLVLIGERPGLSAPDSLGVYLTYAPRLGRADSERNCVSGIRRAGLSYAEAAHKCEWLAREALARQESGIGLKDESDEAPAVTVASGPSRAPDI